MAKAKAKTEAEKPLDMGSMSASDLIKVIEAGARGEATKDQVTAAKSLLQIQGSGQAFRRHILEVVHSYKDKPKNEIPKLPQT